jgi:hypothetical protein
MRPESHPFAHLSSSLGGIGLMIHFNLLEPSLSKKTSPRPNVEEHPIVERLEERTVMSVTVGVSVDGMNTTNNSCGCQPPDTIAAAGPNHVVEMVNTAIEVFDKSGKVTSAPQSTLSFFTNHISPNQSDPFVFYDDVTGQFVAGILDYSSGNAANHVDLATGVDGTNGITWTLHTPIASGEGKKFLDYPRVGYNADAYFIEGNMFRGNFFSNVQVITLNKSGAILSRHDDSSLFTLTPAAMHGSSSGGPEYFVEAANNGGSSLQVVTETNVLSRSPTFTTSSVPVSSYQSGGSPPQPGGTVPSFDDRIFDAAFRTVGGVNHLVAAHQVAGLSVPVVARWYDINTSTMSLIQSGNAPAVTSGSSQFMPSVDINTAGSIGMTFDESSSSEYWSMYVTERTASDGSGTMEAPVLAVAGTATSPDSRVGDFSGTTVDPFDGLTFWSANQYQGSDFWDTHIASFSIAGAAPVTITTALPATNPQPAQNLSATTALDTGPRTPTLSRSISQLARRTPPSVAPQSQPLPQSPWVASGPVRQTVTLSTVRL